MCPKTSKDPSPSKPLSGIKLLMESCNTELQLLRLSKLIENTIKFIQHKLDSDKPGQDWTCSQNIVKLLAPLKYYRSHPQYFPT